MATYNDITGDPLKSKAATQNYRNNYDAIFGKKETKPQPGAKPEVEQKEENE